jgi:ElaB/YqjD/DUF883 family membrane-anchored ribosome-binding protein
MTRTSPYPGRGADYAESSSTDLKDKAIEKVTMGAEKAASHASPAEQGREAGEPVQEVAGNVKGAVDKSLRDQPIATLAVAAAVGFILGALWKS